MFIIAHMAGERFNINFVERLGFVEQEIADKKPGSDSRLRSLGVRLHESFAELLSESELVVPSWRNVIFGSSFDAIQHRRIIVGGDEEGVVVRAADPPGDFDVIAEFTRSKSTLVVRKNPYLVDIRSLKSAAELYDILVRYDSLRQQ